MQNSFDNEVSPEVVDFLIEIEALSEDDSKSAGAPEDPIVIDLTDFDDDSSSGSTSDDGSLLVITPEDVQEAEEGSPSTSVGSHSVSGSSGIGRLVVSQEDLDTLATQQSSLSLAGSGKPIRETQTYSADDIARIKNQMLEDIQAGGQSEAVLALAGLVGDIVGLKAQEAEKHGPEIIFAGADILLFADVSFSLEHLYKQQQVQKIFELIAQATQGLFSLSSRAYNFDTRTNNMISLRHPDTGKAHSIDILIRHLFSGSKRGGTDFTSWINTVFDFLNRSDRRNPVLAIVFTDGLDGGQGESLLAKKIKAHGNKDDLPLFIIYIEFPYMPKYEKIHPYKTRALQKLMGDNAKILPYNDLMKLSSEQILKAIMTPYLDFVAKLRERGVLDEKMEIIPGFFANDPKAKAIDDSLSVDSAQKPKKSFWQHLFGR